MKIILISIFLFFLLFLGFFVDTSYAVFVPLNNICNYPCIPGVIAVFNYTLVLGVFIEIIFLLLKLSNKGNKFNHTTIKIKYRARLLIVSIIIISFIIILLKNQLTELVGEFIFLIK